MYQQKAGDTCSKRLGICQARGCKALHWQAWGSDGIAGVEELKICRDLYRPLEKQTHGKTVSVVWNWADLCHLGS